MVKYAIYYRKTPDFRVDKTLKSNDVSGRLFAWIITIEVKSKDEIFSLFQGEIMPQVIRARIQTRRDIMEIPLHTSMSVGDCIKNTRTGTVYQCAPVGWEKVK